MITTVFITRCLRKGLERALLWLAACVLIVFAAPAWAESAVVDVSQMRLERTEEGVLLSTNLKFDLPPVIEDALQKGIPMFFVAEAVLFRDRWYWYDKQIATVARHMRLSYQPLTRRWRLVVSHIQIGNSGLALGQNFDTQEEALAAVQRISRWRIAETGDLEEGSRYNVDFKFRLDTSQLPRPFQIGVVGQGDWNISVARNQRLLLENAK